MAPALRLYRIRHSTNVERVTLALAHKGLQTESVWIEPDDRGEIVTVSGQPLVPVIVDRGRVVRDSTAILEYLEEKYPDPPLYPADTVERARMRVFIDWFNRVWKRPPNEIEVELGKPEPDAARIDKLGAQMAAWLGRFEVMLSFQDYLFGTFSAADCAAFPFLKYALKREPDDDELFHRILDLNQPLGDDHANVAAWITRVDAHPRAG
jgi:glutathione S-transferase